MEFQQILKKYRYIVDKQINDFFNSKPINDEFLKTSYEYLKEFVLRPGKRIRPIASIMAYKAIMDKDEKQIYPICIIPELFHASSLIHDDIMDEDLLRRNKPTMHKTLEDYYKRNFKDYNYQGYLFDRFSKRFSVSMAIIQGNILYSLSYSAILESRLGDNVKNNVLNIFNKAYCRTNEGQIFDLLLASKEKLNEKNYVDMVTGKTVSPLSAAILFGAILNNANSDQLKYLEKYAFNVGIAFQILDDIMDISKTMNKGRELGTDIRRGNKTLLVIKALENADKKQKEILLKVLGNEKAQKNDVEKTIDIIEATGALKYVHDYAKKNVDEAKGYLKKANLSEQGSKFFRDFADYMIKRKI